MPPNRLFRVEMAIASAANIAKADGPLGFVGADVKIEIFAGPSVFRESAWLGRSGSLYEIAQSAIIDHVGAFKSSAFDR